MPTFSIHIWDGESDGKQCKVFSCGRCRAAMLVLRIRYRIQTVSFFGGRTLQQVSSVLTPEILVLAQV